MHRSATLLHHVCASSSFSSTTTFTPSTLSPYNGTSNKPIYFALQHPSTGDRVVFDVTQGKSFYGPGGGYFVLAGHDASRVLATMDLNPENVTTASTANLDDLTPSQRKTLEDWFTRISQKYPQVGTLKYDDNGRQQPKKVFTPATLRPYDGENGKPIYIALKGRVFDVSQGRGFYGPGGAYSIIAGRDASRALATMDLEPRTIQNTNLSDLTSEQQETLDGWVARLSSKYPEVGVLNRA